MYCLITSGIFSHMYMKAYGGEVKYSSTYSETRALDGCEWSVFRLVHLTPGKVPQHTQHRRLGRSRVDMDFLEKRKSLAPIGNRTTYRPV